MEEFVREFQIVFEIFALFGAYLTGSVNTARIFAFATGNRGILETGTGNAGANNFWRVYSKKYGNFIGISSGVTVMFLDIGKGVLIAYVAKYILGFSDTFALICGIMGMIGHNWPIWWKFRKGGKGIALFGGALWALYPLNALIMMAPLFILPFISRLSGLIPFVAVAIYIVSDFILALYGIHTQVFREGFIAVLLFALFIIYLRRVDAERLILKKQPSKLKALWYLLIYDRATNDPPPLFVGRNE